MNEYKKQSENNTKKNPRIAKFLAACGLASRRKCEELVLEGKIKINKKTITDLSYRVLDSDVVEYKRRILKIKDNIVIALNKPPGYISTVRDDFKRKTVLELVNEKDIRLFPVGRLDAKSRGLLLLTNNGELAYRILHPKFQIPKIYHVKIQGGISSNKLKILSEGIRIEERILFPIDVKILKTNLHSTLIEIKIIEGRKRIIRKTLKKLGYKVLDLKRIQIGGYRLNNLKEGSYKILSRGEINSIINSVHLNSNQD